MSAGFSAAGLAAGFTFSAAPQLLSGMAGTRRRVGGAELRRAAGVGGGGGGDKASPGLGQAPSGREGWNGKSSESPGRLF